MSPSPDPYAPEQPGPHLADCSVCDWSRIGESAGEAKILAACHFVVKHPQEYGDLTGKDAALAEFEYMEFISAYRRFL